MILASFGAFYKRVLGIDLGSFCVLEANYKLQKLFLQNFFAGGIIACI